MFLYRFRTSQFLTVATAAIACFAAGGTAIAAAPNVIYTATGTFATPAVSGNDLFKLAGQPFTIQVVANAATVPTSSGQQWARYTKLTMQGTVQSGLLPTPIAIASNMTSLQLATGNPSYDLIVIFAPIKVIGIQLQITATIQLPKGTLKNGLIHPFTATAQLNPTNTTVIYSDGTNATTLTAQSGTIDALLPNGGRSARVNALLLPLQPLDVASPRRSVLSDKPAVRC